MPAQIRIERVPIRLFNLGLLGADHLQLVYERDRLPSNQNAWYVLEGLRDGLSAGGPLLGVLGVSGTVTLSEANGNARDLDLVKEIGYPEVRGSVVIPTADVQSAWDTMANYGDEIDKQGLPYSGYSFITSDFPTLNSTSVIASLLFSIGVNISHYFGLR